MTGEAVLDEESGEIEESQEKSFQLLSFWAVAGQHPGHVFHRSTRFRQDSIETIQEIHPVV